VEQNSKTKRCKKKSVAQKNRKKEEIIENKIAFNFLSLPGNFCIKIFMRLIGRTN
jgi:hypothetical protein